VPWQLTTKKFLTEVKGVLRRVIDEPSRRNLIRNLSRTLS
jgi:hypothetical protein